MTNQSPTSNLAADMVELMADIERGDYANLENPVYRFIRKYGPQIIAMEKRTELMMDLLDETGDILNCLTMHNGKPAYAPTVKRIRAALTSNQENSK